MKFRTVFGRPFPAPRQRTAIAFAKVEVMINVTIKVFRPVKPRSGSQEDPAREPLRTVISIWSTVIWGNFVVSVGTNRRFSNVD
jgi:hypothetical protein